MSDIIVYKINDLSAKEVVRLAKEIQPIFVQFAPKGSDLNVIVEMVCEGSEPHLMTYKNDGQVIGFVIYHFRDVNKEFVCDIHGVVVDNAFRSHGVFREMLETLLSQISSRYVLLLTRNPRVYETLKNLSLKVLPHSESGLAGATVLERMILSDRIGRYLSEGDLPVMQNLYTDLLPVPDINVRDNLTARFFTNVLPDQAAMAVVARIRK